MADEITPNIQDFNSFAAGAQQAAPRVFQAQDGSWWEYDPRRPEGQRFSPATTANGQQIGGVKPPADKAPSLIRDRNGNPIGYWDPDKPQTPVYFDQAAMGSQVPTPLGGGYIWNPANKQVEYLPTQPTPQNPTLHNAGNTVLQQLPDGSVRPVYTNLPGIAKDQAAIDAENRRLQLQAQAEQRMGRGQDIQGFNSYWANLINASQADEQAQQNAFTRDTRLLYDLPRQQLADENAAQQAQYQTASTIGQYETGRFNAGRGAANDRVMAMLQTLPYRASPQFAQQFAQRRAQEAAGEKLTAYTPEAFTFRAPDLNAERQAGYAEAGVTGGVPNFEELLARSPAFATMDPEELRKIRMNLSLAYVPGARLGA